MVYGDIGTSPLYALKECFWGPQGFPVDEPNVLGILSLIFWSLNFVVTFKYLTMVMRADNRGEGGILALLALARPRGTPKGLGRLLVAAGLFGSALLYGDGIITPAISVLGAVEGLSIAAPALQHLVVPIAFVIILGLFFFQRRGTAGVGAVFGPVTLAWFLSIATPGHLGIVRQPAVLRPLNPWHAVGFLSPGGSGRLHGPGGRRPGRDRRRSAVRGHGSLRPAADPGRVVRGGAAGAGAQLLRPGCAVCSPSRRRRVNPFYSLVPGWGLYPMVAIATAAAVVASQALISGAFSLTRQAVQLGYCPRVTIGTPRGPRSARSISRASTVLLAVACMLLVLSFRSTGNLASAYGIAVTGTMTITTILFCVVARDRWHWPRWRILAVGALFLSCGPRVPRRQPRQDRAGGVVPDS